MRVNLVMPALSRDRFTAGTLALMLYANGLTRAGHQVQIVAGNIAVEPRWIQLEATVTEPNALALSELGRRLLHFAARGVSAKLRKRPIRSEAAVPLAALGRDLAPYGPLALQRGAAYERLGRIMPDADVTVATSWETVLPVYLYGTGETVHFVQHYEVLFADEYDDPRLASAEARLAYAVPMSRIANVGWLAERIAEEHGCAVPVCWAGIDHETFKPGDPADDDVFTVVTYGGRNARWKGFPEGMEAIRLARETIPKLRWRVFGGALIKPQDATTPYEDLGFVVGEDLRQLYSRSHVTMCPSWYEGFPYPPLEAMTCGSTVIATPLGAGDVTRDRENALIVPPRDPRALADALVELWRSPAERLSLRAQALADARGYTWERSIARFEELIGASVSGASPKPGRHGQAL